MNLGIFPGQILVSAFTFLYFFRYAKCFLTLNREERSFVVTVGKIPQRVIDQLRNNLNREV